MTLTPREQARRDGIPESQLIHYPDSLDTDEQERHKADHQEQMRPTLKAVPSRSDDDFPYPAPNAPLRVARRVLADLFTTPEGHHSLAYWRGDWYRWVTTHWERATERSVRGKLWVHLDKQVWTKDDTPHEWAPTRAKIADVLEALQVIVALNDKRDAPMWIDRDEEQDPAQLTSMANGLFHWKDHTLRAHTPQLFNEWSLPYNYQPEATAPRWESFIASTFANDPAGARALQEFSGYALTNDADRQKGLMLIGPSGGGKGVINRILVDLVGKENVASTDPHALRGEFGLWPLIGKPLVVLSDARSDGPINAVALGRLLNIIGQDALAINRKGAAFWTGYLPARVVWISNDLPRFNDTSGAILRRWIVIRLNHAVAEAQQDKGLTDKLKSELSGIFNWALQGLSRLNHLGYFTTPDTQGETLEELRDTVSPVSAFLHDCYEVTGNDDDFVAASDVLTQYRAWAEANGREKLNRETLRDRVNSCPEPVAMKNTVPVEGVPKGRFAFGINKKMTEWTVLSTGH